MSKLNVLDLSLNPVTSILTHCFSILPFLKVLILKNVPAKRVSTNIFFDTYVKVIVTTNDHISCVNPEVTLSASYPYWYLCSGILPAKWMQILIFLVSLLIVFTSTINIYNQMKLVNMKHTDKPIVIAISICDFLCGLYLCIILIADITYHQTISTTEIWRSHYACFIAFGIILWYSILSQCLLLFKSVIQILLVFKPFESKHKQNYFTVSWISFMYVVTLSISFFLTCLIRFNSIILPTPLCMPFIDPTHSILLMKIITMCIVITQTSSSVTIIIMFWLLITQIKKSAKHFGMKRKNDKLFTMLVLTACSAITCWLLPNFMYLVAMFVPQYPYSLVVVTVALILPFNAIFMHSILILMQILDKFRPLFKTR